MALIELALQRALTAYAGKVDKAGQPYILHPLRLQAQFSDQVTKAIALLHDVIEDSDATADDLRADGIPEVVIAAVELLTRVRGESYEQFIERVGTDPLARKVKKADIQDNLDVLRLAELSDSDLRRVDKYHRAWHRLNSFDQLQSAVANHEEKATADIPSANSGAAPCMA